jgi:ATP-dependent Lon protease
MEVTESITLLPLEIVLLPGEMVPLHIFEERYKGLISRLRTRGGEFGVVLAEQNQIHEAGCSAVLTGVVGEYEDGRLDVLIEGQRRFRIAELRLPDDPESQCLEADVTFIEDQEHGSQDVRQATLRAFSELLRAMGVERPQVTGGGVPLSFRLAATLDFGIEAKQALLESLSESERLAQLAAVAKTLLPRVKAQRKRSEAIRGDGKGM